MRRLKGYTLDKLLDDNFSVGQFFILIELINEEAKREKEAMNKKGKK